MKARAVGKKAASKTAAEARATTVIRDVTITNTSAANEHTRAAVEALSAAAKANAEAITAIASALRGSPATMENGILIGGTTGDER